MKAIVTGGAGFIGLWLVESLAAKGLEVTVVDDGSTGAVSRIPNGVNLVVADISTLTIQDWESLISPGSTIYHLGAKKLNTPGVTPLSMIETNINATTNLAIAAKSRQVASFVFASSLYVYGHRAKSPMSEDYPAAPETLYGMTKLTSEKTLESVFSDSDVRLSIARLFFVYGPRQFSGSGYKSVIVKNLQRIMKGEPPEINGTGEQVLDYVFVQDVVEALILLAEKASNFGVYNVSSGRAISISQLVGVMLEVAGISGLSPLHVQADWTEGTLRVGDSSRLANELSWRPQFDIEEGLRRTWKSIETGEN